MPRANPMRGEVSLGDRKLKMDFGAWIAFEEMTGRTLPDHLFDLGRGLSCADLVKWVQGFCTDDLTPEEAIALISRAGYPQTLEAVKKASERFFGALVEDDKANPPLAA